MHATTPLEKSETVLNFCSEIVENSEPVFIDVTPKSDSIINDCFINVEKIIRKKGGEIVYGWQIWEWPNVMIEAEFHAVWLDNEGLLHDVTPKPIPNIRRILFVTDNSIKYEEKQVNNI